MKALQKIIWNQGVSVKEDMTTSQSKLCYVLAGILWVTFATAASVDNDWYHPEPPSFSAENTPLILPFTTARPALAFPAGTRTTAISKLANAAIIPLIASEWRELKFPVAPSELLERLINQKETEVEEYPFYLPGLGHGTIHHDSDIRRAKELAAYWRTLKTQLHPYLVRAVATDGHQSKFFADVWKDVLTITHHSVIDAGNDPLKQRAALVLNPMDVWTTKAPLLVYLEKKPTAVYTNIQIVRFGD